MAEGRTDPNYPGLAARKAGFQIWHESPFGWRFASGYAAPESPLHATYEAAAKAADAEAYASRRVPA